jgi:CTP:molybdopterin cytidylyltransferase MocA
MGRPKLLLPWGETTVIGATVAALHGGGIGEVVLVAPPGGGGLAHWAAAEGWRLAVNPHPEGGMLSSIRAGLAAAGGTANLAAAGRALVVCPADLPALRPSTVAALIERFTASPRPLAVPLHQGRRGHPLLLAPRLIPEIDTLDPEVGLHQLLDRHPEGLLEVEVDDPGVVRDIDTPAEYEALVEEPEAG